MSTEALHGLLEYLQETLSFDNQMWLAEHIINPGGESLPQLTMEEINERIKQSEQDYAEGKVHTNDEMISFMNEYLNTRQESSLLKNRIQ